MSVRRAAILLLAAACGCEPAGPVDAGAADAAAALDGGVGCGAVTIALPGEPSQAIPVNEVCTITIELAEPRVVEVWVEGGRRVVFEGIGEAGYLGPVLLESGAHRLTTSGPTTFHLRDLGAPPGAIRIERSLTWTDAVLLDDPSVAGWDRAMRAVTGDAHPGPLVDAFFRRFGTTAHSERLGPLRLLEDQIAAQGSDPTRWDLDAFPFRATGVHHRIDLADATHCGEVRLSYASTHPLHQPFHMILLFRQEATPADRRPDGTAHCAATALAWARLSALDDDAFRAAARAILDAALVRERFLVLETVELIISPWEWRQWFLEGGALENRPLFQTVDAERLNRAGPDRDDFLAWVDENAAAIDARAMSIPSAFRSESARVNDGVPWIPLDLGGVAATATFPALRQHLEIVGCPACHATDADFVQTLPDRTFSPFYERELVAREAHLRALAEGRAETPPFGPLQEDPRLPP